jgi:putative acetyltransferase
VNDFIDIAIRRYRIADLPALATIYAGSIRELGSAYYSDAQVAAWSSFADDRAAFRDWIEHADTFVASDANDGPVGFTGLDGNGHVTAVFVAPSNRGQGIATRLLSHLLNEAKSRHLTTLTTAASELSRPLFEKFGFQVRDVEHTVFKDIPFDRYAMQASI